MLSLTTKKKMDGQLRPARSTFLLQVFSIHTPKLHMKTLCMHLLSCASITSNRLRESRILYFISYLSLRFRMQPDLLRRGRQDVPADDPEAARGQTSLRVQPQLGGQPVRDGRLCSGMLHKSEALFLGAPSILPLAHSLALGPFPLCTNANKCYVHMLRWAGDSKAV